MGKTDLHDPDRGWTRLPDGDYLLCGNVQEEKPRHLMRHMFIYKNQIMYDVTAQVSIVSKMRRNEKGVEDSTLSDGIDSYEAMFDRWIQKYVEKVKERLIMCLHDIWSVGNGDELRNISEYEFLLSMPDWWDDTAWKPLVSSVHDYIVNSVLSEYFRLTLTAGDGVTQAKMEDANEAWNKIKACQTKHKQGTIRKFINPMGF